MELASSLRLSGNEVHEEDAYEIEVTFEKNAYCYAFVCANELVRPRVRFYAYLMLLFSVSLEIILAMGIWSHVNHESAVQDEFIERMHKHSVEFALYGGQQRIGEEQAEKVCGSYSRWRERLHANYSEYSYKKLPVNDWNPARMSGDFAMLDEALVVHHMSTTFPQNVEFVSILFLWLLQICLELRNIWLFSIVFCLLMSGESHEDRHGFRGFVARSQIEEDELSEDAAGSEDYTKLGDITCEAVAVGVGVIILRILACGFVGTVGVLFLMSTANKLDLILNCVALVFILDLDDLIFRVAVMEQEQQWMAHHDPIKISDAKSRVTFWLGPIMLLSCIVLSLAAKHYQATKSQQDVAVIAAICLFMGPSPSEPLPDVRLAAAFPVPGLCESLLFATCEVPLQCMATYNDGELPGECIEYGHDFQCTKPKEPPNFGSGDYLQAYVVVAKMQEICAAMWQSGPHQNGLRGTLESVSHFRVTDTSASSPDETYAAPFWCPFGEESDPTPVGRFFNAWDADSPSDFVSRLLFHNATSTLARCSNHTLRWRNLTDYPSNGKFPLDRQDPTIV